MLVWFKFKDIDTALQDEWKEEIKKIQKSGKEKKLSSREIMKRSTTQAVGDGINKPDYDICSEECSSAAVLGNSVHCSL